MSSWSLSTENPKCRPHAHVWAFTPSCVLDSQEIPNKDSRVIRMKNTHCFSLSAAPPFVAMWPPSNARSISPQIVRYYCFNSECPNNTVPCPSCCDTRSCFTNNPFFWFFTTFPRTTAVLYRTVSSTFWEKKPAFLSRRQLCEIARIGDDKTFKNDSARKNGCLSIMFPFFSHVFGDVVLCVEPWYCERALFSLPLPSRG